jgi:tetratricopeptide (TPR) repeat protein
MMNSALLLLASMSAQGAAPAPAQPAPPPRAPPAAPAPASAPTPAEIAESAAAIRGADPQRLLADPVYAAGILRHLDRVAPVAPSEEAAIAIDILRLYALITIERRDDAAAAIDRMIARGLREPSQYAAPMSATLAFNDNGRALLLIESASRSVPGVKWAELRSRLARDWMFILLGRFRRAQDEPSRVRLAEALFRIGWPGGDDAEGGDFIRTILVDDRIAQGDTAGAAGIAAGISTPSRLLPMLVGRRYDPVLAPGEDRLELLRRALDRRGRETAEALAAAPSDLARLVDRAKYLRGIGRDAEALALLQPSIRDVAATTQNERGIWAVDEAAYALSALGRSEEALALMERAAAIPLSENGALISLRINHLDLLWAAGRNAELLDRAVRLDGDESRQANDYGKMWIAAARACALAGLGRTAEAAPQLERLRALGEVNPVALSRALLCVGDLAGAEALLVRRLGSADPDSAILALQDYEIGQPNPPIAPFLERLTALRDRPAVRAALDRAGRVLRLPLPRSFWSDF